MPEDLWVTPDVVPSITYADVAQALEWLQRVFGFRERTNARLSWPGGSLAWLEVGASLFQLKTPDRTWGEAPGPASGFMKVYVDDVDGHFLRARGEGATIVSAPEEGFWGGRIYRALDHEGHRWEFSQRGRDLAPERWQLPPGVTRGVAGS